MSDTADTRIVEMQFQNKDFEKNIATSQKSLEKFKKELNFDDTSKGLEEFSRSMKAVNFSTLESNVQKLTDKFTGLGNAGEFVLSRIRRTLEQMGDQVISFANSLTTVQAQAGFVKYETLNKSVQTLRSATGKEEKEIYGVLERLNKYTDETSYDFAQGVTSISQLVSSGAATLGQAEKTVEGFYNFAAKAGADTQKASQALQYSMVQAFQRGYLDWGNAKELSTRSLLTKDFKETLLETAVALGTVVKEDGKYYAISKKSTKEKKVEVNTTNLFNDSLQHQWATSAVLNATLAKYADTTTEFGEEAYAAAQRCTTFTDALNAWKDMLSTGWMSTYRIVFGDLSDAMSLFSAVCNKVSDALSGLVKSRNDILTAWKDMGGRDSLMGMLFGELEDPDGKTLFKGARGILDLVTGAGDMISEGWWNMVKNLIPEDQKQQVMAEVNKHIDEINRSLEKRGLSDYILEGPFKDFDELWNSKAFQLTSGREDAFGGMLEEATRNVQNFVEGLHDWFNATDEISGTTRLEKIQTVLNAIINTISFGFEIFGGVADFVGMIFSQLEPSIDAISTFFSTLAGGVEEGEQSVRNGNGITKFFTNLAEILRPVTGAINSVVTAVTHLLTAFLFSKEAGEGAANTWESIKNVLSKVWNLIKSIAGPIVTFITTIIESLANLFENGFTEENVQAFRDNVSTAFKAMLEGVQAGIKPVYDAIVGFLSGMWGTVSKSVSEYFADETTIGHKILAWFTGIFKDIKAWLDQTFPGLTQSIGDFFTNIWEAFTGWIKSDNKWEGIKTFWSDTLASISDFFSEGIGGAIQKIRNALSNMIKNLFQISEDTNTFSFSDWIRSIFAKPGSFGEGVEKAIGAIIGFFKMTGGKALIAVAGAIAFIAIIAKVYKVLKTVARGFENITEVLGDRLKLNFNTENFSDKMLKIAGALAILTACIYVLGNMKLEQGIQGVAGVILLMASMRLLIGSMKNVMKNMSGFDMLKMVFGMYGVAIAIGRVIKALKPLSELEPDAAMTMGAGLFVIVGALAAVMALASKTKFDWKAGTGMLAFAFSIGVLIDSLKKILQFRDAEGNWDGDAIIAMIATLGVISVALGGVARMTKGTGTGIIQLAGLAVSIGIMILALKQVTSIKEPGDFLKMGGTLLGIVAVLTGFIWAVGRMKSKGSLKDTDLWQLIGLAAAIGGLILALKQVVSIGENADDWRGIGKMGAVFGGIILGLVVLIAAVNKLEGAGARGLKGAGFLWNMVGLAGGIVAIIYALKSVADAKPEQLTKMGLAFSAIIIGLSALMMVMNMTSQGKGERGLKGAGFLLNMVGLAGGIVAIVEVLKSVADLEPEKLKTMGVAWIAVVGGLVALMYGVSSIFKSASKMRAKGGATAIAVLGIVLGIMIAYGVILHAAKDGDWKQTASIAAGIAMIALLVTAIGGIVKLLSGVDINSGIKGIGLLAGAVAAIIGVIGLMAPWVGTQIGSGIANLMGGMSRAANSISNFSMIMAGISGLSEAEEKINAVIRMVKSMVGIKYYRDEVDSFAASAFSIGVGMMMFQAAMNNVQDPEESKGFKALEKLLGMKDTLKAFNQEVVGLLSGSKFTSIGAGLKNFDLETSKMEDPENSNAFKTIHALSDAADALNTISTITISGSGGIATKISELGSALKLYAEGADALTEDDVDDEKVQMAATLIERIAGVMKGGTGLNNLTLPNLPDVGDEHTKGTLSYFGVQLVTLAGGLQNYVDACKGIGLNAFGGLFVLDFLAGIKARLANGGNVVPTFEDENGAKLDEQSLSTFGTELTALSTGLGNFIAASKDVGNVEDGIAAIDKFMTLKDKLTEKKKAILEFVRDWNKDVDNYRLTQQPNFADKTDLAPDFGEAYDYITAGEVGDLVTFANNIGGLGLALQTFAQNVTFTAEQKKAFDDGVTSLDFLVKLQDKLPTIGGVLSWFTGKKQDFNDLSSGIEALGGGLANFYRSLTADGLDYNNDLTVAGIGAIGQFVDLLDAITEIWEGKGYSENVMGQMMLDSDRYATYIKSIMTSLSNAGTISDQMAVRNGAAPVQGIGTSFSKLITDLMTGLGDLPLGEAATASDILRNVAAAIGDLVSASAAATDSEGVNQFTPVGLSIASGVAVGIRNGTGEVAAAARDMVQQALAAAKDAAAINSPSHIFRDQIGWSFGEGTAVGVLQSSKLVSESTKDMVGNAVDGASESYRQGFTGILGTIRDVMTGNGMNETPEWLDYVSSITSDYFDGGLGHRVISWLTDASQAADGFMGETAAENVKSTMSTLIGMLSEDVEADPVITPIVDLTNVQAASGAIGNMFGPRNIELSGNGNRYAKENAPSPNKTTSDYRATDLSGVLGKIGDLDARISSLGTQISNMQIVLDSGALVGGVTDGVNKNLGAKATYRRRRN